MKRISLLLAFILVLVPILTACGNDADTTPVSSGVKEKNEYEYSLDDVPELDFGEKQFGIFGVRGSMPFMIAEEETGDLVNDAVFQRNLAIEERYNLDFEMVEAEPNAGANQIRTFIVSGDQTYQLYLSTQHGGMPGMILNDYFVNWNELDALKLENPYWNPKGVDKISFNDKYYVMRGDLNLKGYNSTNAIFFNQKLFDDLGIDYPYQDVYDMTWTIDKMIAITKQGYSDLNGDSEWDPNTDRLGYSGWAAENMQALYIGMGGDTVGKDENGMPKFVLSRENNVKLIDKLIELYDGKNAYLNNYEYSIDKTAFKEGRLLMDDGMITGLSQNRDSEFDVGILPYPMLDEEQGEYFSRAANIAHLCYIPTTNNILQDTGIILEAMSIESYNKIRPAYYDITLSLKEAPDEESVDMVDIILGSSSYMYEGFVSYGQLQMFINSQTNTWASWSASVEKTYQRNIDKIYNYYMK